MASGETNPRYLGRCLCGTVRYEVSCAIERATHCHCSMCRKTHGAAFGSYASVPAQHFRITQGAEAMCSYLSSPGITRSFCSQCGSPLTWLSEHGNYPGRVGFTLGTLDTPVEVARQRHIHVASKAPWYTIHDPLPQSEGDSA
jgi:hypothetical protein